MTHFKVFFFNDTATTEIYTLSLHDALPISRDHRPRQRRDREGLPLQRGRLGVDGALQRDRAAARRRPVERPGTGRSPLLDRVDAEAPRSLRPARSEEHTSELQSPCNLVCRL